MIDNKNEINDNELDSVSGGIKIDISRKPKIIDFLKDLVQKMKEKIIHINKNTLWWYNVFFLCTYFLIKLKSIYLIYDYQIFEEF